MSAAVLKDADDSVMSENWQYMIIIIGIMIVLLLIIIKTWPSLGMHPLIIHLSLPWGDPHNLTRVVKLGERVSLVGILELKLALVLLLF